MTRRFLALCAVIASLLLGGAYACSWGASAVAGNTPVASTTSMASVSVPDPTSVAGSPSSAPRPALPMIAIPDPVKATTTVTVMKEVKVAPERGLTPPGPTPAQVVAASPGLREYLDSTQARIEAVHGGWVTVEEFRKESAGPGYVLVATGTCAPQGPASDATLVPCRTVIVLDSATGKFRFMATAIGQA